MKASLPVFLSVSVTVVFLFSRHIFSFPLPLIAPSRQRSKHPFPHRQRYLPSMFLSRDDTNTVGSKDGTDLYEQLSMLRKQKQFKNLPDDAITIIPRGDGFENEEHVIPINTIVMQAVTDNNGQSMVESVFLVILSEQDKIDLEKLQIVWKSRQPQQQEASLFDRIVLAPSDQLEELVGYKPGCVPPIGHKISALKNSKTTRVLPTIIDERLIQNTARRKLLGGGGQEDLQSLIRLSTLVGMDHVEISDISVGTQQEDDDADDDSALLNSLPPRTISLPPWGSANRPKPFFPLETPDTEQAKTLLLNYKPEDDLPLAEATWVTLVGKLGRVRRMSNRLVFCDLLPPGFTDDSEDNNDDEEGDNSVLEKSFSGEWRSATDGQPISVQLIGGKTLCQAMGEVQGQAALKRLRSKQNVLVQAKVNIYNSLDSLKHWVYHRRLDLTLVSFQVLHDSTSPMGLNVFEPQPMPPPNHSKPNKPFLQFNDVFTMIEPNEDNQTFIKLVDDMESLESFSDDISHLLESLPSNDLDLEESACVNGSPKPPEGILNGEVTAGSSQPNLSGASTTGTMDYILVGVDCEWKPNFYVNNPQEQQPVLLLQICIHQQVYILDLQSLCRPLLSGEGGLTPSEKLLNSSLKKLFMAKYAFKVGFHLIQDIQKLALSYPHIPAFQEINTVLETATVATKVMRSKRDKNVRLVTSSLNRLTEYFLFRSVNKEQQVSDWSQRPLTPAQLEYAALDAAVNTVLMKQFFDTLELVVTQGPEVGRWKGDATFSKFLTSYALFFLQPDADPSVVKKLKAKPVLPRCPMLVVTQLWNAADEAPKLPHVPDDDTEGPYTDVFGIQRVPSTSIRILPGSGSPEYQTFLSNLVGKRTGKSKEKCLTDLLEASLRKNPEILPEDARLQYPPRSGYVEFENGVALFVNMPLKALSENGGVGQPRSYPNEWLEGGKVLTWYVRDYEWKSGRTSFATKLLDPSSVVMLFVRVMSTNYFLCCGPCEVMVPKTKTETVSKENQENWSLVQLNLKLLEWEKLQGSDDFLSLVV